MARSDLANRTWIDYAHVLALVCDRMRRERFGRWPHGNGGVIVPIFAWGYARFRWRRVAPNRAVLDLSHVEAAR